MNRYPLAAGAAGLFTLLVACGSSSESAAPTSAAIEISGFAYSGSLTVKSGQNVTVTNKDPTRHTLTDKTTLAGQTPAGQQAGLFSTGTIPANGETEFFTAPATPGNYPFGCRFHPTMTGTLVVQG
jgi:plastocyanin